MIIMKFGGSSVADAQRIRNVANIVKLNKSRSPVVVVSALGGVTDSLITLATHAVENKEKGEFEKLKEKHITAVKALGLQSSVIDADLKELKGIIDSVSLLDELSPRTLDKVVSFGERLSSKIVAAYLSKMGLSAKACNAYDIGLITDSHFGDADYLPEAEGMINKALSRNKNTIPVITGYIGKDKEGEITTLGRGGSDYTASIVGAAINAGEIQIWTDVDGIMTADPRVVKNAKNLEKVSYSEASELAFMGAKVLHPKTILPAIRKNIPVKILNTFNPGHKGTIVLKEISAKKRIASIACKKKIKVININNPQMLLAHGFLKKVFEAFDNNGISVDMVATSDVNISVTLDGKHNIDKVVQQLERIAQVEVFSNRAKVSLVGKNMAFIPGLFGKMFSAIGDIEVEMISSSSSEINQSFVVREEDADKTVRKLHKEFFGR